MTIYHNFSQVEFENQVMKEKREQLTAILIQLMDQKKARQEELTTRLSEMEENRTEEDIMGLLKFAFYDHHTLSLVLVQLGIILPSRLKSLCVKVFLKPLRDFLPPQQPADKGTTIDE